jgi:hypothetical protein
MKLYLMLFLISFLLSAGNAQNGTIIINKITNPPSSNIDFNYFSLPNVSILAPFPMNIQAGYATFGAELNKTGITGTFQMVNSLGCDAPDFAGFIPGNIAVIDRGTCSFVIKVANAEAAGAIGVVILNHTPSPSPGSGIVNMGGEDPGISIPAVSVSYEDGLLIKSLIGMGMIGNLHKELQNFTLQHGGSKIFSDVPPGTYYIYETPPDFEGAVLSDIIISDPSGGSISEAELLRRVVISLDPGETVECTFITDLRVIEDLSGKVDELLTSGSLNSGQANALLSKLKTAETKLAEGNTNAALNILKAFINQVEEFILNGILSEAEGQPLIDQANDFIALIISGSAKNISMENSESETPADYELIQNYPNPFNPETIISWYSPAESWQTLRVYDVLGNEVATLIDEIRNAGFNSVRFDGSGLSSGIYFYTLHTEGFTLTKKLLLLK